jgi:hypothetical protein
LILFLKFQLAIDKKLGSPLGQTLISCCEQENENWTLSDLPLNEQEFQTTQRILFPG